MHRSADRLHYKTLKVEPGASLSEIRRAYHRASLKAHPDHGGSHSDMLAINAAWTALNEVGSGKEADDEEEEEEEEEEHDSEEEGSEPEKWCESDNASDWDPEYDDQEFDKYYDYGDLSETGGSYVVQLEDGQELSLEEHALTCACGF